MDSSTSISVSFPILDALKQKQWQTFSELLRGTETTHPELFSVLSLYFKPIKRRVTNKVPLQPTDQCCALIMGKQGTPEYGTGNVRCGMKRKADSSFCTRHTHKYRTNPTPGDPRKEHEWQYRTYGQPESNQWNTWKDRTEETVSFQLTDQSTAGFKEEITTSYQGIVIMTVLSRASGNHVKISATFPDKTQPSQIFDGCLDDTSKFTCTIQIPPGLKWGRYCEDDGVKRAPKVIWKNCKEVGYNYMKWTRDMIDIKPISISSLFQSPQSSSVSSPKESPMTSEIRIHPNTETYSDEDSIDSMMYIEEDDSELSDNGDYSDDSSE